MKGGLCQLENLDLSACENITDVTLHSLAGNSQPAATSGPRLDNGPFCQGRARLSVPSVTVEVLVSQSDYGPFLQEVEEPLIDRDPSFTDLPLELCSLDCLDICLDQALVGGGGGGGLGKPYGSFPYGTTDIFSYCSLKKTCCGSESGDSKTSCCGGDGGERTSCGQRQEGVVEASNEKPHALHTLTHLSLNGCFRISDDGMR